MVTMEEITLAFDVVRNLEGIRKDMRRNAVAYKNLLSTESVIDIATIMKQDASEYLKRLNWHIPIISISNKNQLLLNGLASLNIDNAELILSIQELRISAEATLKETLETKKSIDKRSAKILVEIIEHTTLWE